MNEELSKQLAILAEKLGTSVDLLWTVLMQQAIVDATINLVMLVLGAGIVLYLNYLAYNKDSALLDWEEDLAIITKGGLGLVTILAFFVAWISISSIASALINPEYWALSRLLCLIK